MLRAMDSAVSGLRAHQNKLDVIGNNIANVNTFGYKAQNYSFKEAMYQTSSASTGGNATSGGSNAVQYGYGSMTGAISMDMTPGNPTYLGEFNACVQGTGFFITNPSSSAVNNESAAMKNAGLNFTKVGQFKTDSNGYIVDSNNNFIMGFQPDGNGAVNTASLVPLRAPTAVEKSEDGVVTATFGGAEDAALVMKSVDINALGEITAEVTYEKDGKQESAIVSLGKVAVANFQNPEGLTKSGGNNFVTTPTDNSGDVIAADPGSSGSNLMVGYLEGSNVDLSKEFADMIMTQRGFQANSKLITVSDEILSELINMKR